MSKTIVTLAKSGRVVYPFPWESHSAPAPFNTQTHERVVIPLSAEERKRAKPTTAAHIQIVKRKNLRFHKEKVIELR